MSIGKIGFCFGYATSGDVKAAGEEVLRQELQEGLSSVATMYSNFYGNSLAPPVTAIKSSYLVSLFESSFTYAVDGRMSEPMPEDSFSEMIGLCMYARINGELFGLNNVPVLCESVLAAAFTRSKVDQKPFLETDTLEIYSDWFEFPDLEYLTFPELAYLANVDEQTVKNATQATKDRLETVRFDGDRRAYIPIETAVTWLRGRRGYVEIDNEIDEESILVPEASDGTRFGPWCRMRNGFKVGAKGDEKYFPNLTDALKALEGMDGAKWRRPNAKGIPGIVSVKRWVKVNKAEWMG
jgi:hypothetical protein